MSATPAAPSETHHVLSGTREQWATRAVFLVAGLAMAAWAPLVPFAKARVGVEDGALGLLLLCLGLGSIVAMPITGVLASRFGCRAIIVASTIAVAIVVPFLAVVDTVPGLAIALALFGASVGTVDVAMNIQAVMVEKDSGRNMMSGFHGLFSLGGIVGAGGVSLLLGFGVSPLAATLAISAMLAVLLVYSFSGLLPYGNREAGDTPLFVVPKGIVIFIGLLCFLVFLGEGAILDWSALFLIGTHQVDPVQAGFGYTMFAIAMTLGRLTGDKIVKALGGTKVVVIGGLLAAAGFLLAVFAPAQPLAFAGFLLVGLGASNIVPVLFTAAGNQTRMPASLAIAAITTLGYAGILAGPAAIGFIAQHWTLSTAFILVAVGLVFVAVSWPLTTRRR
ncbi:MULTISPECIES: MFS transporter [unclassified Devosia]|jgi:predicted MFS family arabinose efflux permease|uniref:MFS transporter n=1 Tax=unclassified Devosia TaxID=196773 RepID=UPI000715F94D|nr:MULTISPECIES: MFS transporter [unclassified Devosia]KQN74942.1 MFS transporter [Devosia sp. Leaf64]KQT42742.1 MFS transporter [Devosia sp. Leaf420]